MATNQQIISANVEFYRQIAQKYDHYESCASDSCFQRGLELDLTRMEEKIVPVCGEIRCLDCGCGTGNLALKMLKRGWTVTVVDVSDDMLEILRSKVRGQGYAVNCIKDSIENVLSESKSTFQVVSFSSVLHHLYSPVDVVERAVDRIALGGFFYSNFDPVRPLSPRATRILNDLDTIIAKVLKDRSDVLPGIWRRFQKMPSRHRDSSNVGDLAEFHARNGVDDQEIARALLRRGFQVDCRRFAAGRTDLLRWLNRRLGVALNFSLLAQRLPPTS